LSFGVIRSTASEPAAQRSGGLSSEASLTSAAPSRPDRQPADGYSVTGRALCSAEDWAEPAIAFAP
jgi:hypothetical protein